MNTQFRRLYRAALLDYILGDGEIGLERAFALGRRALEGRVGVLSLVRVHHEAVNAILETDWGNDDRFRQVVASQQFLIEALAPFEMAYRGYVDYLTLVK